MEVQEAMVVVVQEAMEVKEEVDLCRIQWWWRYSRPRRVCRVYDLMLAGVSTRLGSLIITWDRGQVAR